MQFAEVIIGGILLAIQLSVAISLLTLTRRSTGTLNAAGFYMVASVVLIFLGTLTYIFGSLFFTEDSISYIGTFYMISAFVINLVRLLVINPKEKLTNIVSVSNTVQEFFGD